MKLGRIGGRFEVNDGEITSRMRLLRTKKRVGDLLRLEVEAKGGGTLSPLFLFLSIDGYEAKERLVVHDDAYRMDRMRKRVRRDAGEDRRYLS